VGFSRFVRAAAFVFATACCLVGCGASRDTAGPSLERRFKVTVIGGRPRIDGAALDAFLVSLTMRNLATELRPCPCMPENRARTIEDFQRTSNARDAISIVPLEPFAMRYIRRVAAVVPRTPVRELLLWVYPTGVADCGTTLEIGSRHGSSEVIYETELLDGDPAHISSRPCF
jgi:hypothetical protein